ncbi:MAG TPA: sulfatase-like hydrolase/transferase [Bacteroidales bacterium]
MNRKKSVSLTAKIFAGVFCVYPGLMVKADVLPKGKPNILLILSDDHSAPYLGCYGNPDLKTPNIDRLAKDGIMFKELIRLPLRVSLPELLS